MTVKKVIFAIIFFSILIACPAAYAKEAEGEVFEVTSGIDFSKDRISTFDESKTISGTANNDTEINIQVYSLGAEEDMLLVDDYTLTVGLSGIFTQTIDLSMGENFIVIYADDEDNKAEITVNRKKETVKKALENGVYLP